MGIYIWQWKPRATALSNCQRCPRPSPPSVTDFAMGILETCNWQTASCSTFGPQALSHRNSMPTWSVGSSKYNDKIYISSRHNSHQLGKQSPGPAVYTMESPFVLRGRVTQSTHKSSPAYGFGSASRFNTGAPGTQPGPGKYESHNIWRSQGFNPSSRHRSGNITRIGTEPRFNVGGDKTMPKGTPGPGHYKV